MHQSALLQIMKSEGFLTTISLRKLMVVGGAENWGFSGDPIKNTLPVGTKLDRYGGPQGSRVRGLMVFIRRHWG